MTTKESRWYVRNIDDETKRQIRIYAAAHDLNIAEAIAALIQIALSK